MTANLPSLYDAARAALSEARRIDDVLSVRDQAERMRLYARQAKDRGLMADAMEIQLRAERRLGEMLVAAKEAGQIGRGAGFHVPKPAAAAVAAAEPKRAAPEHLDKVTLQEAGIDRKLSSKAQQLAAVPLDAFETVLDRARDKIVSGGGVVVNPARDLTQSEKRERRDDRAAELSARHHALPNIKAGIIYADPAWKDEEVYSNESGMDRAADNHYPTMTLAEIMDLDVADIASPDCILFMWCKTNNLIEAICVAAAHGFLAFAADDKGRMIPDRRNQRYASSIAWDKEVFGNGRWVRDQHESLLIFRRGNPVAPAPGTQLASVQRERKKDHSAKPERFLDWIDRLWPNEVKIELNRRGAARPGWYAWGNEAGAVDEPRPAPELSHYDLLVRDDRQRGRHTKATAEPIIRAAYGADPVIEPERLASDLGHKVGTVMSWASRLGASSRESSREPT